MLQIYPVEYFPSTNGSTPPTRDPLLGGAVEKFCTAEFGEPKDFSRDIKTWAVVDQDTGEVEGLASLRHTLECHTFHIRSGGDSPEGREKAKQVRNMLLQRAAGSIQDTFGVGSVVLVFVDPNMERFWRGFLRLIGAKHANRYEVRL